MNKKTFLLLGGYGGVGRSLARLLLIETKVHIIIAGRHEDRAAEFASRLNEEFPGNRAFSRFADAADLQSLTNACQGVQLVLVLSTTPKLIKQIGQAALVSGCDYLDILVSESTIYDLNELVSSIQQQKRIFITEAGFHPGLPAVFVRYGAQYFDIYSQAIIAMAMNARFERPEQAAEIIPLISEFKAEICKAGIWKNAKYSDIVTIDMGERFGKIKLFPMQMEEIKRTREMFNLQETGVYVSGFNWFVDYLVIPLIMLTQKIRRGLAYNLLLRLFTWGVNTFSSKYQGVVLLNEARGMKDGKKKNVRIVAEHDDPYLFTAIPVVACLKQYLDGTFNPGLWMMGHIVDENKLFAEMETMGVKIRIEILNSELN
jgi:saccharopine dehydrogenase-like NADP-dependent oxidoreductase